MYITLTIFILIVAILLTLVVLVQNSKGGALAAGFQSSNQYMGVRKTTDFIEKATWGLAGLMIVLSILAVGIHSRSGNANVLDSAIRGESIDISRQVKEGTAMPTFGEVPEAIDPNQQPEETPQN
ncbi:MAG: preprotein translocase subunit SecG [Porphyromonadaceae bacterium]|nr:preprotein translocase subunit SecG [Porphyromonadaceae bacterium]